MSSTSEDDVLANVMSPIACVESPLMRELSTTEFRPVLNNDRNAEVEYFFASDASAVIEHTKQVIFLEDDDVAAVKDGSKSHFLSFFYVLTFL